MPICPVCSHSVELLLTDSPEAFLCLNCKTALHATLRFRPIFLAAFAIVAVTLRMVTLVISPSSNPMKTSRLPLTMEFLLARPLANRSRSGQIEVSFYCCGLYGFVRLLLKWLFGHQLQSLRFHAACSSTGHLIRSLGYRHFESVFDLSHPASSQQGVTPHPSVFSRQ